MGMFDYVTFDQDYELPLTAEQLADIELALGEKKWVKEFQTKDIDNLLNRYHVTKTGIFQVNLESSKTIKHVKTNYTGTITCVDSIMCDHSLFDVWLDIQLTIVSGAVVDSKLLSYEKHSNIKRLKATQEMKLEQERMIRLRSTVLWNIYNIIYRRPIMSIVRRLSRISLMNIQRKLLFWN